MAQFDFDPAMYQARENLEALPPGWYPAIITESEVVENSKKNGFLLNLNFKVIDGPHLNRVIKKNYNIQNPSEVAVEIAKQDIKSICACVGVFARIGDSQALHNLPLQIRLVKKPDSDYNDIAGYKTINGEDPSKVGQGSSVGHQQLPTQGFAQPAATPYPPAAPPAAVPPAPASFPPAGWTLHPSAAGFYYQGTEVLSEADLRTRMTPPAPPAAPAAPAVPAWAPPLAAAAPAQPPTQQAAPPAWSPNPPATAPPTWTPPAR